MRGILLATLLLGAPGASLRTQINASNKLYHQAVMKKDFLALQRLIASEAAPGFQHVEEGRVLDLNQTLDHMKQGLTAMARVTGESTKAESISESGDIATVVTLHHLEGLILGPDKNSHRLTFVGTTNDTYQKIGSTWKMSKMQWTKESTLMDGKSLALPKRTVTTAN